MNENSSQNIIQKAVNSSSNLGQGQLLPTSTTNQKGKYNVVQGEAESTHIGDVYNYYSVPENHSIPRDIERAEPEEFPYSEMYITKELPQNVAVLHIYENGNEQYSLFGGNLHHKLLPTEALQNPCVTLRELFHSEDSTELNQNIKTVRERMLRFSQVNSSLRKWLNQLRKTESDIYLIIVDRTDYEIPWEMITLLPQSDPSGSYAGALITIARWCRVERDDEELELQLEKKICSGSTIAYSSIQVEESIWNGFESIAYADLNQFQTHLKKEDIDCALVCVAGIGTISHDGRGVILGSELDDDQQIILGELQLEQLQLIQSSKSLVFINASYSGVHFRDFTISSNYVWGWVNFFLSRGAQGVIGSLGKVVNTYASEFAHELIYVSQRTPNSSMAELMKHLRYQLVQKIRKASDNEDMQKSIEKLIHSFMYVYYGNPMMTLQLNLERRGSHD